MRQALVWAEMARRKLQFHKDEDWFNINLWGLFNKSDIRAQLEKGELEFSGWPQEYKYRRGPQWVKPTPLGYNSYIKPLLEKYTLAELTKMAGWDV